MRLMDGLLVGRGSIMFRFVFRVIRKKVHFCDTEDIVEYVFQEHEAVRNHNFILYAACEV